MDMYIRNIPNLFQVNIYSAEALIILYLAGIECLYTIRTLKLGMHVSLIADLDATSYKEFMSVINTHKIIVGKNRLILDENSYDDIVKRKVEVNLGSINGGESLIAYIDDKTGNIWDFKTGHRLENGVIDEELVNKINKIKLKYSLVGKKYNIYLIGNKLFEIAYSSNGKANITTEHTGFIYVYDEDLHISGNTAYTLYKYSVPTVFNKLKFLSGFEFNLSKVVGGHNTSDVARDIGVDFGDLLGIQNVALTHGVFNIDSAIDLSFTTIYNSIVKVGLVESLYIDCIKHSILELGEIDRINIIIAVDSTFIIRSDINFNDLSALRFMFSTSVKDKRTLRFIVKYTGKLGNSNGLFENLAVQFNKSRIYIPNEIDAPGLKRHNVIRYDSSNLDSILKDICMEYKL